MSNHLNEYSGFDVFKKGIFDKEEPDFSTFDGEYYLNLKSAKGLVDVLTGTPFIQGQYLKKGTSLIFELCNSEI